MGKIGGGVEQQANLMRAQGRSKWGRAYGVQTICLEQGGMLGVIFSNHYKEVSAEGHSLQGRMVNYFLVGPSASAPSQLSESW